MIRTQLNSTIRRGCLLIQVITMLLVSCKPKIDIPKPSSGSADFTKYIAIGNSLTAGYSNGGLYLEGQKVAFANLLAEQMKGANGSDFNSPFFDEVNHNGSGYLRLQSFDNGFPVVIEETINLAYRDNKGHLIKYLDPIQNFGIPGIRLDQAFDRSTSRDNIYFERLLVEDLVGNKSYYDYVTENDYTFFSLWLGSNDILGYALEGGVVSNENQVKTRITEKNVFENLYNRFVDRLTESNQKGVLATIPDITKTPYFTSITLETLLNEAKAKGLDVQVIYIQDKSVKEGTFPGVRMAGVEDLIGLNIPLDEIGRPNSEGFLYGIDPQNPIDDQFVLDFNEVLIVKDYINHYNQVIKQAADRKGIALADIHSLMNQIKDRGFVADGVRLDATYIQGGVFSLDGVHLSPKGNAIVANHFIEAINEYYDAKLSKLNVSQYLGIKMP